MEKTQTWEKKVDVEVSIGTGSNEVKGNPNIVYKEKFTKLEQAYYKKEASKAKYEAYKTASSDISTKIEDYKAKQEAYYIELHKPGAKEDTQAVIDAKKEVVEAAKKLKTDDAEADKKNIALVNQYVQDNQEEIELFNKLIPDAQGPGVGSQGQR